MSHVLKRRVTVLATAISILLVASIALAAWTTNGENTGTASAGEVDTLDVVVTVTDALYPTTTSDVDVEITNPNPYKVRLTSIAGNGAITVDAGHAACNVGSVSFTGGDWTALVGPNGGTAETTLTDAAAMSNAASNACEGATFTIPVKVFGASE